jgi:hypothetical protein
VQKELLQSITFGEGKLVQLNPHLSAVENADDGTGSLDGRHSRGKLQAHSQGRPQGQDTRGVHQKAAHADIDGLPQEFFGAKLEADFRLNGNTAGAAALVFLKGFPIPACVRWNQISRREGGGRS